MIRSLPTNLGKGKKEKNILQHHNGQSKYENRITRRPLPTHSHKGKKEENILQYDDGQNDNENRRMRKHLLSGRKEKVVLRYDEKLYRDGDDKEKVEKDDGELLQQTSKEDGKKLAQWSVLVEIVRKYFVQETNF